MLRGICCLVLGEGVRASNSSQWVSTSPTPTDVWTGYNFYITLGSLLTWMSVGLGVYISIVLHALGCRVLQSVSCMQL